jgi:uncharacterized Fe-S center protein
MRFTAAIATLAVLFAPSILAKDTTTTEASTTTITRTVLQATATSTIVRSSSSAVPTSTYFKHGSSAIAATPSASTIPGEFMGAASMDQSNLVVAALAGAAVIVFGL